MIFFRAKTEFLSTLFCLPKKGQKLSSENRELTTTEAKEKKRKIEPFFGPITFHHPCYSVFHQFRQAKFGNGG